MKTVLKVQRPLETNGVPEFLLYNEERSIMFTSPVESDGGMAISGYFLDAMGAPDHHAILPENIPAKVYVEAEYDEKTGRVTLMDLCEDQEKEW